MAEGRSLSQVTERIRTALGVKATILPMSDDQVETRVMTREGEISFQEFFVKEHWSRDVEAVRFAGVEQSRPAPGVLDAIRQSTAVVIAPSNPVTSIGPILAVSEIRKALRHSVVFVVGVSPIIGATAISGPAHKLMAAEDREPSAFGVADGYRDLLNRFVIDGTDAGLRGRIENLGIRVAQTSIRMTSLGDKRRLAREVLALIEK
jgi:LPPG:FO 2-phospho-L-lactate transferase